VAEQAPGDRTKLSVTPDADQHKVSADWVKTRPEQNPTHDVRFAMADEKPTPAAGPPPATDCPVIPAEVLFKDGREVWIDHAGERYKLRITRRGKLILQK
jgi:hemin uptake protein HemP